MHPIPNERGFCNITHHKSKFTVNMQQTEEINIEMTLQEVIYDRGSQKSRHPCSLKSTSVFGFLVIIGCTSGVFKHEKSAVVMATFYKDIRTNTLPMNSDFVVEVDIEKANFKQTAYQAKLVYWKTSIVIDEIFTDGDFTELDDFKVSAKCARFERVVEMWQTCDKVSKWSNTPCDVNIPMNLSSKIMFSTKVFVSPDNSSRFFLTDPFISQINWRNIWRRDLTVKTSKFISNDMKTAFDGENPKIGDYKIHWNCYGKEDDEVSILGKIDEKGTEMVEYQTDLWMLFFKFRSAPLAKIYRGDVSLENIIENVKKEHQTDSSYSTVFINLSSLILLMIGTTFGFISFTGPLTEELDRNPCCGEFLTGIEYFFAMIMGILWFFLVYVLCWCLVDPWYWLVFGMVFSAGVFSVVAYKKKKVSDGVTCFGARVN